MYILFYVLKRYTNNKILMHVQRKYKENIHEKWENFHKKVAIQIKYKLPKLDPYILLTMIFLNR